MSKRMTAKDWDDVADLCEQASDMVETGVVGEEPMHTRQAKDKAAVWIRKLTWKATDNARRLEAKEGKP